MQVQIVVVVFPGAGNHNGRSAQIHQRCHHHIGGAAAAQNQSLFLIHTDTAVPYQRDKAKIIGVVPIERTICSADDGIHGTDFPGGGGQLVQIGDDIFFVGNGHIDAAKIPILEKRSQLFRLFFKKRIGIIAQHPVNLGGIAVSQLPPQ